MRSTCGEMHGLGTVGFNACLFGGCACFAAFRIASSGWRLRYTQARNVRGEDYKRALRESLHKYMKLSTLNEESASADKRKDTISHFILRLAYCRSEDLRRWFLTQVRDVIAARAHEIRGPSVRPVHAAAALFAVVVGAGVKLHLVGFSRLHQYM